MKREIKFRIWAETDDSEAEMIYLDKGEFDNGLWFGAPKHLDAHHEAMQWTGLKDMHGVDIYEGDVVEHLDTDYRCLVVYDQKEACFCANEIGGVHGEFYASDILKVLGNMFENPELLNPNHIIEGKHQ